MSTRYLYFKHSQVCICDRCAIKNSLTCRFSNIKWSMETHFGIICKKYYWNLPISLLDIPFHINLCSLNNNHSAVTHIQNALERLYIIVLRASSAPWGIETLHKYEVRLQEQGHHRLYECCSQYRDNHWCMSVYITVKPGRAALSKTKHLF